VRAVNSIYSIMAIDVFFALVLIINPIISKNNFLKIQYPTIHIKKYSFHLLNKSF